MATASPVQVAGWVIGAGWPAVDQITATAIGLATGADPTRQGGLFGIGGPPDGAGQAGAALAAYRANGWKAFPAYPSARRILLMPAAGAAVAAADAAKVATAVPNPVAVVTQTGTAAVGGIEQAGAALTGIAGMVALLTQRDMWIRASKVAIGAALIFVGSLAIVQREVAGRVLAKAGGVGRLAGGAVNTIRLRRELRGPDLIAPPPRPAATPAPPASPPPASSPPAPTPSPAKKPTYKPRHQAHETHATERRRAAVSKSKDQPPGRHGSGA